MFLKKVFVRLVCGVALVFLGVKIGDYVDELRFHNQQQTSHAGAVVVTPESPYGHLKLKVLPDGKFGRLEERDSSSPKSSGVYGRCFWQPGGAYLVEVSQRWFYVLPGRTCRTLTLVEMAILKGELDRLNRLIDDGFLPTRSLRPTPEQQLKDAEKQLDYVKKILDCISVPMKVQEYLRKVKGIPIDEGAIPLDERSDPPDLRQMV